VAKGLVSAVIPTVPKRKKQLDLALRSVNEQNYTDIETVVVNDSSISAPEARNRGIRMSNGEFVAPLDDDDTWKQTKTEKQIEVMNRNPDCPLVICWSRDLRFGGDRIAKPPEVITHKMIIKSFNLSSTSAYLIRKKFLEKELFDLSLHSGQEYDLAIRLSKYGDIRCVQEVLMVQNASEGQISENWSKKIKGIIGIYSKYHNEYTFLGHIKTVALLFMFSLGFIFGNKIYCVLRPAKEFYEKPVR